MQTMTIKEFLNQNKNVLTYQEQRALETLELILKATFIVSWGVIGVDTIEAIGNVIEAFRGVPDVITAFKVK